MTDQIDAGAALRFPDFHRLVVAGRDQSFAIGTESNRVDGIAMAADFKGLDGFPIGRGPDFDAVVEARRGDDGTHATLAR